MPSPEPVLVAHIAPASAAPGSEAACGYILQGVSAEGLPVCARCAELHDKPREGAFLARIHQHQHVWACAGSALRSGGWMPVWRCDVCGDEVADIGMRRHFVEREVPNA